MSILGLPELLVLHHYFLGISITFMYIYIKFLEVSNLFLTWLAKSANHIF